jgi:hypothetical protein
MAAKALFDGGVSGKLFLDRRQFYIEPQTVAELWPSVTPFTTILEQLPVKSNLSDPVFKMFEREAPWIKQEAVIATVSAATLPANDTGLTCTLTSVTGLKSTTDDSLVGLICEIWDTTRTTKRAIVVITANSSGTYTIKNLTNTASSATIVATDILCVVGNAAAEGDTAREAWADELSVVWNSTQRFEVPVNVTGTLYKAALRGYSSELARLREDKMKEFKMQREQAFLKGKSILGTNLVAGDTFAETNLRTKSSLPIRTTYGIISAIEDYGYSTTTLDYQNIFTIAEGSYKYSNFVDDMEKVFQYDGDQGQKFALCGPGAMSYWSKLDSNIHAKSGWSVKISEPRLSALGFNIRVLETPHGILHLVPTKALKYQYNKYMLVIDHNHLFKATYDSMQFKNNVKTDNNYHGVKDVYESDEGVGIQLIKAHQLFKIV